ncbi:LysR family transcriptional regulator [Pseudomonas sp.]|uniref:LysR family transcriptional regulator n=1 Tax=Pseudomonas sp. TaxID=306 RepID=UPI002634E7EB|nr:LysR family transcriptional regulator [Pseudomonas sp.]
MKLTNIDIDLLRALVFVSNAKGFTKAAEKLFRTQSAISLQIKKLENITNTKLLERGKEIRLTPAGLKVYEYALKILTLNDDLINTLSFDSVLYEYKIGLPEYPNSTLLKTIIKSTLHSKKPCVFSSHSSTHSCNLIEQHLLDIAFILQTELTDGVKLAASPLSWVAASGSDIYQKNCLALVLPPEGSFVRLLAQKTLNDHARPSIVVCSAAEFVTLNTFISANIGIGVMPSHAIPNGCCIVTDEHLPRLPDTHLFIKLPTHANAYTKQLASKILEACDKQTVFM